MIDRIAKKEFTEMWSDGRFRWSSFVVLILLVTAVTIGWKNYTTVKSEQVKADAELRESWEIHGSRNPHQAKPDAVC